MAAWLQEYSAALDARDAQEQANNPILQAYSKLADRVSELESAIATATPPTPVSTATPPPPTPKSPRPNKSSRDSPSRGGTVDNESLVRLRTDLQTTQRARQTLQSQLSTATSTVTSLRSQLEAKESQLTQITRVRELLERKIKDRDDEIKGKGRLATEAQDEMVALQLQLNVLEKNNEELKKENQMLVERWMKEMGDRADKMNIESKWH